MTTNHARYMSINKKGRGLLVSLEGIEGAGKSTQLNFIADFFRAKALDVTITREPGGTYIGESIRHILLDKKNKDLNKDAELLLLFAARTQHYHQVIRPALKARKVVICDRFTDSSYAYQGGGRGIAQQKIAALQRWALDGFQADMTLLFDVEPRRGLQRIGSESDRFEREQLSFFIAARTCYLKLAQYDPERIKVIDANASIEAVQQQLRVILEGSSGCL